MRPTKNNYRTSNYCVPQLVPSYIDIEYIPVCKPLIEIIVDLTGVLKFSDLMITPNSSVIFIL